MSAAGPRSITMSDLYVLPGDTPHRETVLGQNELITRIDVPVTRPAARSRYLKVRDRASFEFALVPVAAVVALCDGVVREANPQAPTSDMDMSFIDRPDPSCDAMGARGFGEVPSTGPTAAIGNAVHHAIGHRIRDLPITPDKVIAALG